MYIGLTGETFKERNKKKTEKQKKKERKKKKTLILSDLSTIWIQHSLKLIWIVGPVDLSHMFFSQPLFFICIQKYSPYCTIPVKKKPYARRGVLGGLKNPENPGAPWALDPAVALPLDPTRDP